MSSETQFIFNFTKFQQDQEEETVNQELFTIRQQHNYNITVIYSNTSSWSKEQIILRKERATKSSNYKRQYVQPQHEVMME